MKYTRIGRAGLIVFLILFQIILGKLCASLKTCQCYQNPITHAQTPAGTKHHTTRPLGAIKIGGMVRERQVARVNTKVGGGRNVGLHTIGGE